VLPIPLNPVGMVPIIFAIAFATFPYLLAQLVIRLGTMNQSVLSLAQRVEIHLNIYSTQNPSLIAIVVYFVLIVAFTFFYTLIQYNPEKIADSIQKK
jgi:preprotein translocase subunit SecY